jgi:hypothetical protein
MKRKHLIFIGLGVAMVFTFAVLAWPMVWGKHEIVGVVENVKPPICTQNTVNPTCEDEVITIRTKEGSIEEYKYPPKLKYGEPNVTSLHKGTKIKLIVSQGKISEFELIE